MTSRLLTSDCGGRAANNNNVLRYTYAADVGMRCVGCGCRVFQTVDTKQAHTFEICWLMPFHEVQPRRIVLSKKGELSVREE